MNKYLISSIFVWVMMVTIIATVGAQEWKTYPYHQEGSVIYFPEDEGWHPDAARGCP